MGADQGTIFFLTKAGYTTASSRMRAFHLAEALGDRGYHTEVTTRPWDGKRTGLGRVLRRSRALAEDLRFLARADRNDVVVVQRTVDRQESLAAAILWRRLRGGLLIFDFDDAVFEGHPTATRLIVRHADAVFGGSDALLEYARQQGGRAHYVPTGVQIDRYHPTPPPPAHDGFTVGWVGNGPDYIRELELLVQPLSDVRKKIPVRFVCVGTMGDHRVLDLLHRLEATGVSVERFDWMAPPEVRERIAGFHVGVMPLTPTARNVCKCGAKLLEYMAMARPVVASPVGQNLSIVEQGRTGLFAATPEEWTVALETLAFQPDYAQKLGEAARKAVEGRFTLDGIAKTVEDTLNTLRRKPS